MRERRIGPSRVSITKNENEGQAIKEGLDLLEIRKAICHEDVVVITANWVSARPPETADVIGNITLDNMIAYFKKLEPKRIVVAAGSGGGDTHDVMKRVGYDKVILAHDVEFVDLNEGPFVNIPLAHKKPASTHLNALINDMTFHVSFTQLKIHEEGTMSASIKNMAMSWPPTAEHGTPKKATGIHDDLHGFIAEMALHIPIDLSIVSASPVMIGTGPHNGISVPTGMVICGVDPVSTDTIGARLLGFKPQAIHYLYTLGKNNIGETDVANMELTGISLKEAEELFCQSAYHTNGFIVDK